MPTKEELLTQAGSLDEWELAETYNTWSIDTTNLSTYAWTTQDTPDTTITPDINASTTGQDTTVENLSYSTETKSDKIVNPYDLDRNEVMKQKYDLWTKYADAVSSFDKWDIVDKMRLKTWWVADLDAEIDKLRTEANLSLSKWMEKYSWIIDFRKRQQLINNDEQNIRNQISDLSAIRQYRVWAIKDMTEAEITRWEQKLRWLEAQYELYSSVLWDITKADQVKIESEKTALDIQKRQLELKWLESQYWYTFTPWKTMLWTTDFTGLADQYPNNASFKNNNPWNIKYNETWANTLKQYWIEIQEWTKATDWGNFARYNSIEDALWGRQILLFKTATYPNMTVDNAMKRYSNNWYWAEVSSIDWNKLMKDLTQSERATLIKDQLKREDPAMYRTMIEQWLNPEKITIPGEYTKTWLSEAEKKEAKKKEEEWPLKISTVKEFNDVVTQLSTPLKFNENINMDTANSILKDNIWKWELTWTNVKYLQLIASPKIVTEYIIAEDIDYFKWLISENNTKWVIDEVRSLIKWDKDTAPVSEKYMKDILVQAWIINENWIWIAEWFKENNFMWLDDEALNELQWILDL